MKELNEIKAKFAAQLDGAASMQEMDNIRVTYMGKNGIVKDLLREVRSVPPDARAAFAKSLNDLQSYIEDRLAEVKADIEVKEVESQIRNEWQDVSLPGYIQERGALHPLTKIERQCMEVMSLMGFRYTDGPEVENAFNNFDALNVPLHHPARDLQDTFWLENGLLLRSHTSTVQIRTLLNQKELPIQIVSPGRVYRNETVDATHLASFHQFEGLWVDKGINFSHLKGTIEFIINNIFGDEWDIRMKPKFYPYTEPSVGVDIRPKNAKEEKWITILGAGMVHPNVFRFTGHDPEKVSGFAFGLGVSRMVSMAHHVRDMKSLYESDLRVHQGLARKDYI